MCAYHEFWADASVPRPHQQCLFDFVSRHAPDEAEQIRRAVQARLREQEVSYNILGAPDGSQRPWVLDEVPHVIRADEFAELAAALASRARLLEACLLDLYGPQRLLREGIIPAELVLSNPHYFRPLHGLAPVGGSRLTLYAADVVKDSRGRYVVHSDRTAAPTGFGYALENRLALGQILSGPFRDYRIRKVNRFFEVMRQTLRGLSPRGSGAPRIVLLTPGLHDESSFEHAYLARYQGLDLVEGRDLTVRGDEVFLKTLEGLKRVDVIVRRVVADYCDPLELRQDSVSGVAGLVSAARAQTVGLANPLGSGLVESPAFRAYLPAISGALFGEPVALPSVPTRYLGDPSHLEEVLDTFESWLIRPAFDDRRGAAQTVAEMPLPARENLRQQLREAPGTHVAEQWPEASRAPVGLNLSREGALSLRLFACRSGADYQVMPGGLGRVDDTPDGLFLTVTEAATSKDVWVIGEAGAQEPAPPSMPETPLEIRRGGVDLPSRLFDDIFWLGRYAERSHGSARLIRACLEPMASEDRKLDPEVARAVLRTLSGLRIVKETPAAYGSLESVLLSAIYDGERENSIRFCLGRVYNLTTAARSRLSRDIWGTLRRMAELYERPPTNDPLTADEAAMDLDELLISVAAFHGIIGSNMVRGQAWVFLEFGRRLEHGVFVLTLLSRLFPASGSRALMETLLSVCDSLLTYRSRYLSMLQAAPVVDLVLTDETNPQSVIFQVQHLLRCIRVLPRAKSFPLSRAEQRLIVLEARLLTADPYEACRNGARELRELAEEGIRLLWQVSDDLTQTYFTHATRSHAMPPAKRVGSDKETDE